MNWIKDIYLTGKLDDFVVSVKYPNLHIVLDDEHEFKAPIYSERMRHYFDVFGAGKEMSVKVDRLYSQFIKALNELNKKEIRLVEFERKVSNL